MEGPPSRGGRDKAFRATQGQTTAGTNLADQRGISFYKIYGRI